MSRTTPRLVTAHLLIRLAAVEDAPAVLRFYEENCAHLTPWWPEWKPEQFTLDYWQRVIRNNHNEFQRDVSSRLFLFPRNEPDRVIGLANLSQLTRGAAQYAVLGYGLAESEQGKGYMTEALSAVIRFAFEDLHLHRIMANYLPRNERSGAVLKRLGFTVEGYARDYLRINGQWEDHLLTSLTNPDWEEE